MNNSKQTNGKAQRAHDVTIVVCLMLGQLAELGLIQNKYALTTKGFDIAMGLIEGGLKPTIREIFDCVQSMEATEDFKKDVFLLLCHLNEEGYEEMKKTLAEFKALEAVKDNI